MTRILIADDHEVVRSGLRSILEAHPGWQVVAEAVDGKEAVVMSFETRALPLASTKGPVGLSDTATPLALPGMVAWSTVE